MRRFETRTERYFALFGEWFIYFLKVITLIIPIKWFLNFFFFHFIRFIFIITFRLVMFFYDSIEYLLFILIFKIFKNKDYYKIAQKILGFFLITLVGWPIIILFRFYIFVLLKLFKVNWGRKIYLFIRNWWWWCEWKLTKILHRFFAKIELFIDIYINRDEEVIKKEKERKEELNETKHRIKNEKLEYKIRCREVFFLRLELYFTKKYTRYEEIKEKFLRTIWANIAIIELILYILYNDIKYLFSSRFRYKWSVFVRYKISSWFLDITLVLTMYITPYAFRYPLAHLFYFFFEVYLYTSKCFLFLISSIWFWFILYSSLILLISVLQTSQFFSF
jgi:hypothetical protein